MKVAVVQHRLRQTPAEDIDALIGVASAAREQGAQLLVFPEVPSLNDGALRDDFYRRAQPVAPRMWLIPHVREESVGQAFRPTTLPGAEELGRVALPVGDAVIDPDELKRLYDDPPNILLLAPRSRSDIQAEAVLELAIGLSKSVCGLVIVADPVGAEPGEPGHGGSAIMLLGEVLAEAIGKDDVLVADVPIPVPPLEPREELPEVPPILLQRLAHDRGERLAVDYPVDPS